MSTCQDKAGAYVQCRAMDTSGSCFECPPINFETIQASFTESLSQKFMMALAYASPNDSEAFCDVVKDGVCADYAANTCCCGEEITEWQNCLITTDLATAVGQTTPCSIDCAPPPGPPPKEGGSTMIIVVVIIVLLLGGGLGGGYFYYKKRQAASNTKSRGRDKTEKDDGEDEFKDERSSSMKSGFLSVFGKGSNTPPGSDSEDNSKNKKNFNREDSMERGGNKRYDEDDSISNKYGDNRYNKLEGGSPRGGSRKKNSYRDQSFDDDDISDLGNGDLEPRRSKYGNTRPASTSMLPDKIESTRKISSRELKDIIRDREEKSRKMNYLQDEIAAIEDRLAKRDREAEDLRRDREDQNRRIRELEEMNARLQQAAMNGNGSVSGSSYGEGGGYNGHSTRSKASMGEEEDSERRERGREGERERRRNGRSRSASGRSLGGRSTSGRQLQRAGSNRSLARSPSSSRGLGKQASSMRREKSRERLQRSGSSSRLDRDPPREYSTDRMQRSSSRTRLSRDGSRRDSVRSKSPRSLGDLQYD